MRQKDYKAVLTLLEKEASKPDIDHVQQKALRRAKQRLKRLASNPVVDQNEMFRVVREIAEVLLEVAVL